MDKLNEKISENTNKLNEHSSLLKSIKSSLNQQTILLNQQTTILGSIKNFIDNLNMTIQGVLRKLPNNSPPLQDSLNNSGNSGFSQKSRCSAKYNRRNNRK